MKKHLLLSMAIASACTLATADDNNISGVATFDKPSHHTLWYNQPAGTSYADWEEYSLPIGNGELGGSIFGSVTTDKITFNEKSLWAGNSVTRPNPYHGDYLKFGSIWITDLSNNLNAGVTDYVRYLDIDNAVAGVAFADADGTAYTRTYIASQPDHVMAARYTATGSNTMSMRFTVEPGAPLVALSQVKPEVKYCDGNAAFSGKLELLSYASQMSISADAGATVTTGSDGITVSNAREIILYVTGATDYDGSNAFTFTNGKAIHLVGEQDSRIQQAKAKSWQQLLDAHTADFRSYMARVNFGLTVKGKDVDSKRTTKDLIDFYGENQKNKDSAEGLYLEQLYYHYGRYLLISSNRHQAVPNNLQGLWCDTDKGHAPWNSDIHPNINIQMNYWPVMQGGLQECAKPFVDYVRTLVKPGAVTARDYFGARGWTASISANPFGFTAPLRDRDMSWNLSPVAGPWLAAQVYDIYTFSRDKEWLRNEAYPIIKGAALFCQDFLWRKPDGNYTVAPSTSPEHGIVDDGVTFCQAVVRELLTDAVEAANILGVDQAESAQWQDVLRHLPPYRIGRYGQLMEWSRDIDDPKDEHRHVNHLFGLHPGHTVSWTHTPELAKAARVVLEHRGDGATGWSMGWKLNLWARLLDGNHAYKLYGNLLKNGTADNLWDLHPPFQIDGNFGGTAGVTEMLLQSQDGDIHLLPALPDAWADGEVKGLCARGNFVVDITWRGGQLAEARVRSNSGEAGVVRYKGQTLPVDVKQGETLVVTWEKGKLQAEKAR